MIIISIIIVLSSACIFVLISTCPYVPVDNCIQNENANQRTDDVEDDVGPKTVNVDVPEIHSETQTRVRAETFLNYF